MKKITYIISLLLSACAGIKHAETISYIKHLDEGSVAPCADDIYALCINDGKTKLEGFYVLTGDMDGEYHKNIKYFIGGVEIAGIAESRADDKMSTTVSLSAPGIPVRAAITSVSGEISSYVRRGYYWGYRNEQFLDGRHTWVGCDYYDPSASRGQHFGISITGGRLMENLSENNGEVLCPIMDDAKKEIPNLNTKEKIK